jgi:hypothetical protein
MPRKKKKIIIQCQEIVCRDKHSLKKYILVDTHQCTLTAKYIIGTIDLYVCGMHATGIDKKQLKLI